MHGWNLVNPSGSGTRQRLRLPLVRAFDMGLQPAERGQFVDRQNLVDFQDDHEPVGDLADAADEIGAQPGAEARWRLDVGVGDVQHRVHRVHGHADDGLVFLLAELDDHDATAPGGLALAASEPGGQVDDGHDPAAQVDHPAHEGRHHRNVGGLPVFDDFLDRRDRYAEYLPG